MDNCEKFEQDTFERWFISKQGESYDSMYVFARDSWQASAELKDKEIAELKAKRDGSMEQFLREQSVRVSLQKDIEALQSHIIKLEICLYIIVRL